MKKLYLIAGLLFLVGPLFSEPFVTQEAHGLGLLGFEVGVKSSYAQDTWKQEGTATCDRVQTLTRISLFSRFGLLRMLEVGVSVPYRMWQLEDKNLDLKTDDKGLGQVRGYIKYNVIGGLAVAVNAQAPTADVDKTLGEGTNVGAMVIFTQKVLPVKTSINVGYLMKMKYKDEAENEYNPADPIFVRAAAEVPLGDFSIIGEAIAQMFNKSKYKPVGFSEEEVANSDGSTIDLILGAQYNRKLMKARLGVSVGVGDENYRAGLRASEPSQVVHFYDSWDWKVLLQLSYKIKIL